MPDITDIHPKLSAQRAAISKIRNVVAGAEAVKEAGTEYLPLTRTAQPADEYQRLLVHTNFFPATARMAKGKRGLMFAKNVVLNAPVLESIKSVITPQCDSLRDAAEEIVFETLQTNFTGLLVDHPKEPQGVKLNAANAIELNYRPFLHIYPFESILWIDYAPRGNTRTYQRVVLEESCLQIIELLMLDGQYVQRVWRRDTNESPHLLVETNTPTKDGVPLTEIPFVIVSDNSKAWPQDSTLKDLAELNLDHYRVSSRISNIQMYGSGVVPVFTGVQIKQDDNGKDIAPNPYVGAGGIVILENENAKYGFLEPEGHTLEGLLKTRDDLQEQMAKVAGNLIASERNKAPESDTSANRRSQAEDSEVSSTAQTYARRISKALTFMSRWMDGSDAEFTLNTDYRMNEMSAQERTVALAELQAGVRSWDDWFYERRDKGVVNSSLTPEAEHARIEQDTIDRPPTAGL